jgi:hypothetical protein
MKVNTFEKCVKSYNENFKNQGGWDAEDNLKRIETLRIFPYSIIVEGNYLEHDMATQWNNTNFGLREEKWTDLWYGKIDYDYGFWEFFFKEKKHVEMFEKAVDTFYAETAVGKWKTDSDNKHIDL